VDYDPVNGNIINSDGMIITTICCGMTYKEYVVNESKSSKVNDILDLKKAGFKLADIYKMHERRIL
jgi:hypothetical protein